jgi:hypothetical protein
MTPNVGVKGLRAMDPLFLVGAVLGAVAIWRRPHGSDASLVVDGFATFANFF